MILKEVCIENIINLVNVIEVGVNWVEFCDNLVEGGIFVSYGIVKYVVKICYE